MNRLFLGAVVGAVALPALAATLSGDAAYGDWRTDAPGTVRKITAADLPAPRQAFQAAPPAVVARPAGAELRAPPGFAITQIPTKLEGPRLLRVAPNGDVFNAESEHGRIHVLRVPDGAAKPSQDEIFAGVSIAPSASPSTRQGPIPSGSMSARPIRWCAFPIATAI
jgi:glucose/arabinose dehydrogenase